MTYTISPEEVIIYPPEYLREFHTYGYEHIDNLLFTVSPEKLLGTRKACDYLKVVKAIFNEMGWEGDGVIELINSNLFIYHTLHFVFRVSASEIIV